MHVSTGRCITFAAEYVPGSVFAGGISAAIPHSCIHPPVIVFSPSMVSVRTACVIKVDVGVNTVDRVSWNGRRRWIFFDLRTDGGESKAR